MPSNMLSADVSFPTFTGREKTDDKIAAIQNYLFMLLEQLRYTLSNLDTYNFNEQALADFSKTITEDVTVQIADELGDYSLLAARVDSITLAVVEAEGGAAMLRLTNGEATNDIALTMSVTNSEDGYSLIEMKSGSLTLAASEQITLGGRVVFADEIIEGITMIDGGKILTNTLIANKITSGTFRGMDYWSHGGYDEDYSENGFGGFYGRTTHMDEGSVKFSYITPGGAEQNFGILRTNFELRKLLLQSSDYYEGETHYRVALKLAGNSDVSIDAGIGYNSPIYNPVDGEYYGSGLAQGFEEHNIFIGTSKCYNGVQGFVDSIQTIRIGNAESTIYLTGDVYLNGVPL